MTRILTLTVAVLALGSLTACASLFTQNASPLPLETINATQGSIASTRAFETDRRLYVTGQMKTPLSGHIGAAAHVDVQLVGRSGRVIAEIQNDIDPAHPKNGRARSGRYSYVASFPIEQARQAAKVRVSYHSVGHDS